jgi:hypothetical protein
MNQPMRFIRMSDVIKVPLVKLHTVPRFALIPGVLVLLAVPTMLQAQVSSNEINYFSRCRDISDNQARLACYDNLYDRAVGAVRPRSNTDRMMEENRRMREELARIRKQTGGTTIYRSQPYSRTESYPATNRAGVYDQNKPAPVRSKAEEFGKKQPLVVKSDNGKEELYDRIKELRKVPNGWIVTLESGQVWRQMYSKRYNLQVGQEVKISPTIWGDAYRMSVSKLGSFIQVERIQ